MWKVMIFMKDGTHCATRYYETYTEAFAMYRFFLVHPIQYATEPVLADVFEVMKDINETLPGC